MGKDRSKAPEDENGAPVNKGRDCTSESGPGSRSESDEGSKKSERSRHSKRDRSNRKRSRSSSRKAGDDEDDSYTSPSESESDSDSYSDTESGSSEDYSESEDERRRRKRRERKKREEKERRRRKEKEKKRRRKEKEEKRRRKKKEEEKKKKKSDKGKTGAVTNLWGKYGIIRETDMWNKRPEFTAWLAEVKKVNLESLPNWEEKQMFKEFMEDHNTATFPSKKYYNLDAYHRRQMEKEIKRGSKKVRVTERTVFNDEEQRRLEMLQERERQKEGQVEALKRSMQSGMAQAMKEQAQLKEEMAYQYKIGNFEAAAAIQRRLDPDVAM
ncbi:uncharacterized protein [Coffea arabica]|uniref:Uncharacterized protein n=1 Tax=Coffea arabica TaxID=13443 RepID=A0A6P6SD39_COFAR|nr:vicilin-like seed storage protein At2g18540 [Coffea arabica]